MEIHVAEQASVFLWTAISGLAAGFVYELFRLFRKLFGSSDRAVLLCDILFWIISASITFGVILNVNSGQLRWYLFAGFAVGTAIYFFLLAGIVSKALIFITRVIFKIYTVLSRFIKIISKPFAKLFYLTKRHVGKRASYLKKLFRGYKAHAAGSFKLLKKIRKNS